MTTQVSQTQTVQTGRQNFGRRTNKPRNRKQRKYAGAGASNATPEAPPTNVDGSETVQVHNDTLTTPLAATEEGEDQDQDVCWICAEPVKFYSLSECNHRTCHVCALRLRALYKKMDCTFCKHPQDTVIFTSSPSSLYEEYNPEDTSLKDAKLSIVFETEEMMEETLILLRFNCPDEECSFVGKGWNDLKVHVRAVHGKLLCDLCIRHKKVFAHEHTLYTPAQLQLHLPSLPHRGKGSGKEKEVPEGGIHPLCEFCKDCFFSGDELFQHMRERHEECFVCKRQEIRDQYFLDYNSLERHFNTVHHPCTQPACRERKFVVFGSLLDLKAHMVEEHGSSMSTKDMKEARKLETNFTFDDSRRAGTRRERDSNRGGGHETPLHPSTAPAGPSDRRRGGFGAALTGQDGSASSNITNGQRSGSPSPSSEVDAETARRHAVFIARVASLTSNSSAAETSIRSAIRSFRASESTARDVISTFYNIVDRDLEATASLVIPLVDLIDDEDKKKYLLQSFNGFKIEQRQQFPDLVVGGQSAYAGVASGRHVLVAKHSTQTRRNAGQVWDRVARAATSSSSVPGAAGPSSRLEARFPALPRPTAPAAISSAAVAPAFRPPQRSTPWTSSSSSSALAASAPTAPQRGFSGKVNAASSRATPSLSNAAFPSLPSAVPRPKVPVGGNKSLRNVIGSASPQSNVWNAGGENQEEAQSAGNNAVDESADLPSQQRKGKKKGKEKVTLFTLGAFPT